MCSLKCFNIIKVRYISKEEKMSKLIPIAIFILTFTAPTDQVRAHNHDMVTEVTHFQDNNTTPNSSVSIAPIVVNPVAYNSSSPSPITVPGPIAPAVYQPTSPPTPGAINSTLPTSVAPVSVPTTTPTVPVTVINGTSLNGTAPKYLPNPEPTRVLPNP